ncbi:MAG: DUF4118 domain-containing protein [Xanthomonadales bacterium]|nr:DUF4118 domain-containing protein [Xanthomonadales bacterium]
MSDIDSHSGKRGLERPAPEFAAAVKAGVSHALRPYLGASVAVLLTVGLAVLVQRVMPHASLSLLFLTAVLIVAARTGLGPSLFASLLSFLAYNFLFTPPFYTFKVADDGDVATLVFFLLIAAITGNLAARMHAEIAKRRASLQRMSNLYEFSSRIASAARTEEVLDALTAHLCASLGRRVTAGGAGEYPQQQSVAKALAASDSVPVFLDGWSFLPLVVPDKHMDLVAVEGALDEEQSDLARSLCEQAAVALDRTRLVGDLEEARLLSETEQLRSALLSSVSHDLRTPLASIIGSTTSLIEYGDFFSAENHRELLTMIAGEARRLDRYIQNLLDMTRLGQGKLRLQRDWVDLHDVLSSSLERLQEVLEGIPVDIDIEPGLPLLWVHGALLEQALVNLLDNAARFTPVGGRIAVNARTADNAMLIELNDQGPGVPEAQREKIFEMFYTVRDGREANAQGSGLGLAICRGMIGAHGGSISAHAGARGVGTCMRILLPLTQPLEASPA